MTLEADSVVLWITGWFNGLKRKIILDVPIHHKWGEVGSELTVHIGSTPSLLYSHSFPPI